MPQRLNRGDEAVVDHLSVPSIEINVLPPYRDRRVGAKGTVEMPFEKCEGHPVEGMTWVKYFVDDGYRVHYWEELKSA